MGNIMVNYHVISVMVEISSDWAHILLWWVAYIHLSIISLHRYSMRLYLRRSSKFLNITVKIPSKLSLLPIREQSPARFQDPLLWIYHDRVDAGMGIDESIM